jgi:hypothetical protein
MFERILLSSGVDNGGPFWLSFYGGDVDNYQINTDGVAVDANLNVYVMGAPNYDSNLGRIVKFTKTGTIEWQYKPSSFRFWYKDPTTGGGRSQGKTIAVDASGNIYYRYKYAASDASTLWGSFKLDPSGTKLWDRNYSIQPYGGFSALNSGGFLYSVNSGPTHFVRIESQSAGVEVTTYVVQEASGYYAFLKGLSLSFNGTWGISIGSVGGLQDNAIFRITWNGAGYYTPQVWNVDPALGWTFNRAHDCAFDANYNTYIVGRNGSGWGGYVLQSGFLSSGIYWTRSFAGCQLNQVVVDSVGNIIVAGSTFSGSYADGVFIAKLNISGTVLWQRRLTISGYSNLSAYNISLDTIGNIYLGINGFATGNRSPMIVAKLPSDGSLIGTYGNITYASHSAAVNTTTFLVDITGQSGGNITLSENPLGGSSTTNTLVATTETNTVVTLS